MVTELILLYCYDKALLTDKEVKRLISELKSLKQFTDEYDVITLLNEVSGVESDE